jgi:primase-polymerase (primpol)-like protein
MLVKHYHINQTANRFECYLLNEKRIDIYFHELHKQIIEQNYKLGRVLNKYKDWEEELQFLQWLEEDLLPYMNQFIASISNLEDYLLVWNKTIKEWELEART